MATSTPLSKSEPAIYKGSEDASYNNKKSFINPYPSATPAYTSNLSSENDLLKLKEKIAFVIDCYGVLYEKYTNIETRLELIERQNHELLLLLGKDQIEISSNHNYIVEMDENQMREKILEYYKTHDVVYPSDIVSEYNFNLRHVVKIINDLLASGAIEEVI